MQVKELKSEGLNHSLEVTVTAADIDTHVNKRLQEIGKTVRMPGFRPGKAPMNILKQRYGKAILGEVLEAAVNDSTQKIIQERGLKPALQPKIEVKSFDEGKDLTYTMDLEVLPDFKVGDIKSIVIEKPVAKVDDKAVEDTLERVAAQNKDSKPVTEKRAAKLGDITVIDFDGKKADGETVPGMSGNDFNLELGSGQFIPGFEDQLVGAKAGDVVTVNVTFPKTYGMPALAGKDAIFTVTVKELREQAAPVLDDEFAKKLGMESIASVRDAIRQQIQNEYDQMSRLRVKKQLLDALDEGHDFDVPAGLLDMEYQSIVRQIQYEKKQAGEGEELSGDEQDELRAIAERRVRLGLVLSEIGNSNSIRVADQELQMAVIREAQKYPGQERQVFDYYRQNQQALESLRAPLFEDKVVDFILQLAKVTEKTVTPEELPLTDDEETALPKKEKAAKKSAKPKAEKAEDASTEEKPKAKKAKKAE